MSRFIIIEKYIRNESTQMQRYLCMYEILLENTSKLLTVIVSRKRDSVSGNTITIFFSPDQGLNWHPLHWKREVLTTGPPEKSLLFLYL